MRAKDHVNIKNFSFLKKNPFQKEGNSNELSTCFAMLEACAQSSSTIWSPEHCQEPRNEHY